MKRSDFFKALFGGLAGIAVAPLLKAEPKIEKPKPVNIETVTVGHNQVLEIDTMGHLHNHDEYNDHFYFDQDAMASRWTGTTSGCYTDISNFTIVNSAGDELPKLNTTWIMEEPVKFIDPKIAQVITERN